MLPNNWPTTDRQNSAQEMIGQYLFLGGQLHDAKVQQSIAGLLRRVLLTLKAYRNLPGMTHDHLKFTAKASRTGRNLHAVPRATMYDQDSTVLFDQLEQLEENSISAIDPACVTFCHLREDTLTEMVQETLIRGAQSAGLLSHADALPVVCCIPTSRPDLAEIIIRDRRDLDYKVLVLDVSPGDTAMTTVLSSTVDQISKLMPVVR